MTYRRHTPPSQRATPVAGLVPGGVFRATRIHRMRLHLDQAESIIGVDVKARQ